EIKVLRRATLFAGDKRSAKCRHVRLLVIQQPKAGADNLASRLVTSRRDFSRNKVREVSALPNGDKASNTTRRCACTSVRGSLRAACGGPHASSTARASERVALAAVGVDHAGAD